jgi:hypothetical protein
MMTVRRKGKREVGLVKMIPTGRGGGGGRRVKEGGQQG